MQILKREIDIERRVVKWAHDCGFLTPKVRFSETGWPDRVFISPRGTHVYVEFKRPGEKPDPIQLYRMRQLTERGVFCIWCDSVDEGCKFLQSVMDAEALPNTSNQASVGSGVRRAILGSRVGKNVNRPSGDKGSEAEGSN